MTIKFTPEQQLRFLVQAALPFIEKICEGFDYEPGHADLDDEQPIAICTSMTLGEYRRAKRLLRELEKY